MIGAARRRSTLDWSRRTTLGRSTSVTIEAAPTTRISPSIVGPTTMDAVAAAVATTVVRRQRASSGDLDVSAAVGNLTERRRGRHQHRPHQQQQQQCRYSMPAATVVTPTAIERLPLKRMTTSVSLSSSSTSRPMTSLGVDFTSPGEGNRRRSAGESVSTVTEE